MSSADSESVSDWIDKTKQGDEQAAEQIWQRYFCSLVAYAQSRIPGRLRRMSDGEDFASTAFQALLDGFQNGRFASIKNRSDLWRVLTTIAARQAANHVKHEMRQKRGGGKDWQAWSDEGLVATPRVVWGYASDPAWMAQFAETVQRLFAALPNDELRTIAHMRLAGHDIKEISDAIGRSSRTIDRKLEMIRAIWDVQR